jgi:hypothetical protein
VCVCFGVRDLSEKELQAVMCWGRMVEEGSEDFGACVIVSLCGWLVVYLIAWYVCVHSFSYVVVYVCWCLCLCLCCVSDSFAAVSCALPCRHLYDNKITSLPAGVFDGLTEIQEL